MPLTRHLYREDEVAAALAWSILRGRLKETAFWALELLDSGLLEDFAHTVRWLWAFAFGIAAPRWLAAFEAALAGEEVDAGVLVGLVVGLARSGLGSAGRDASVLALLTLPAGTVPDRVGPGQPVHGQTELETYFELACRQGRTVAAWLAGLALPEDRRWELLGLFAGAGGVGAPTASWVAELRALPLQNPLALAVAVAGLCLPSKELASRLEREMPGPTAEVLADVDEWNSLTGRRGRRALAIPMECLYWLTARGREQSVYDSNEKDIMGRLEKGKGLWNSSYWDGVAAELGGWAAVRGDDAVREAFYTEHFPDDIPDEWSRAERAKSHGGGVLQRGVTATAGEWLRRWFGGLRSAVVWDGLGGLATLRSDTVEGLWLGVGAPRVGALPVTHWNLRPARRIVELKLAS